MCGMSAFVASRKVIVLDLTSTTPIYVFAIAAVVLALGIAYWLVGRTGKIMAQAVPPEEENEK